MENKRLEDSATIEIYLKADSGFTCNVESRINLTDWQTIDSIISCGEEYIQKTIYDSFKKEYDELKWRMEGLEK